jgi:hypothetical protein
MIFSRRSLIICAFVSLCLAFTSCSSAKRIYPVEGKVLFEGKPASGAMVQFHPVSSDEKDPLVPQAQVAADGSFRLTSLEFEDGAPAGRYAVTVFWGVPSKGGDGFDRILVPVRYLKSETSGLTAEVPEQETKLKPFVLTR